MVHFYFLVALKSKNYYKNADIQLNIALFLSKSSKYYYFIHFLPDYVAKLLKLKFQGKKLSKKKFAGVKFQKNTVKIDFLENYSYPLGVSSNLRIY